MLDPALIRDRFDEIRARLEARGGGNDEGLSRLAELDKERRSLLPKLENLKRDRNLAGEQVARGKRAGEDVSALLEANKARAEEIKRLEPHRAGAN
jgi:seryl-tRNA synthetase